MDPVLSLVIHEIFPTEILEIIFEEHAILEWEAPTIDERVCRLWRRIILSTPRAWAYIRFPKFYAVSISMSDVRLRLHRSSTAPLHVDTRAVGWADCKRLYNLFSDHCTRIASLRMTYGSQTFFEGRDFPCMRLLNVANWFPVRWGSMPKLHSLRLGTHMRQWVQLTELAPLETLALYNFSCTSILQYSQSLTTLMLSNVYPVDTISGPVTFPSLTYLSLYDVMDLKPHVNAPRLVTYHESGVLAGQSFNTSLPSLVEYGVCYGYSRGSNGPDLATWLLYFPNIRRLAIRADDLELLSFFTTLANQPHFLPALQTISAGGGQGCTCLIAKGVQKKIESLVLVRNDACNGNIMLFFESVAPFRIPIFFARVSDLSIKWSCTSLTHILDTGRYLLKTQIPSPHLFTFISQTIYEGWIIVFVTLMFRFLPLAIN